MKLKIGDRVRYDNKNNAYHNYIGIIKEIDYDAVFILLTKKVKGWAVLNGGRSILNVHGLNRLKKI